MMTVELINDRDCPNVKNARIQLLRAFAETGLPPHWQEWDRADPESPAHVGAYASPTILVNGRDVSDATPSPGGPSCRLYPENNGQFRGVPPLEAITTALLRAKPVGASGTGAPVRQSGRWCNPPAVAAGISMALLPKLTCPACWPAYASLLGALGLGFVNYTPYLFPLTALFLMLAVASLGHGAKQRRGYKPFVLGTVAAVMVIIGKFVVEANAAMYGGIILLLGAHLWNAWPQRRPKSSYCGPHGPTGSRSRQDERTPLIHERR